MGYILNVFKGAALGIAMIIPGVSGGTMALTLGIYERLIKGVNRMRPSVLKEVLPPYPDGFLTKLRNAWLRLDMTFLSLLGVGAVVTFVSLAKVLPKLMQDQHDPTYGFFWGLILASVIVPARLIKKFGAKELAAVLLGIVLTVGLSYKLGSESIAKETKKAKMAFAKHERKTTTGRKDGKIDLGLSNVQPGRLVYIFVAGTVAMSACILPGISGSFVLLLFGVYFEVLKSVDNLRSLDFNLQDVMAVGVTAMGCLVGLLAFARLLEFLMSRYPNVTMSALVGLMVGSLYGIWPFRHFEIISLPKGPKRVDALPIMPKVDSTLMVTVVAALIGAAIVLMFEYIQRKNEKASSSQPEGSEAGAF